MFANTAKWYIQKSSFWDQHIEIFAINQEYLNFMRMGYFKDFEY